MPDPQYIVQVAKSMALALGMDRAEDCMVGYTDDGWDGEDSAGMDGYLLVGVSRDLCSDLTLNGMSISGGVYVNKNFGTIHDPRKPGSC